MASKTVADVIKDGDQVIIKREKVLKVVQLRKGRQIWLQKRKFIADEVIGHPYGSVYELQKNKLVKTERSDLNQDVDLEKESGSDNRDLTSDIANQKLSKSDIQGMKRTLAGEEIVDQLVENSATFRNKTEYAQQKYIKKKKKKYAPLFTVLRPCSRLLTDMYYQRGPAKHLRVDAMAQILAHANIHANCKIMVVESFVGLLVGAVMEKMGGCGAVVHFHSDFYPVRPAFEGFAFPKSYQDMLYSFPLNMVRTLHKPGTDKSAGQTLADTDTGCTRDKGLSASIETAGPVLDNAVCAESPIVVSDGETPSPMVTGDDNMEADDQPDSEEAAEPSKSPQTSNNGEKEDLKRKHQAEVDEVRARRRQQRDQQIEKARAVVEEAKMDGLVVAAKFHPTPVVLELINFLAFSRPFVVYSQYKEPLVDCYGKLRDRGGVINMRLTETWLREHQVLRDRTHPMVNMDGAGGYLLSGIVVET